MLNRDKINKIKGILNTENGVQVPEFSGGGTFYEFVSKRGFSPKGTTEEEVALEFPDLYKEWKLPGLNHYETRAELVKKLRENMVSDETLLKGQDIINGFAADKNVNYPTGGSTEKTVPLQGLIANTNLDPSKLDLLPVTSEPPKNGKNPELLEKVSVAGALEKAVKTFSKNRLNNFLNSSGMKTAALAGQTIGLAVDLTENFIDKSLFANDDPTQGAFRQGYDAVANSLMTFSPLGTIAGGAMKAIGLINDLGGKKANDFAVDKDTIELVGGSYGGSTSTIYDAGSKAGKKYGLFAAGARRNANKLIDQAARQQSIMSDIASDARDRQVSALTAEYAGQAYNMQMTGGYDQRYMRAAKQGTKIQYFKDPFKVNLSDIEEFSVVLSDIPLVFKQGGTILDQLDELKSFQVILSNPIEEFKKGGTIKDREIEVIETNTTLKSVIPEGALHKNKHHLDEVGIDDSELTKKGIPVIDNDGDQQAEIELNEIIFTLEVTKEIESRYREFYKEDTSASRKDELAIEAGRLLWKEIIYNTDDRTGLIDTLKQGGILKAQEGTEIPDALYVEKRVSPKPLKKEKPAFKDWIKTVNPDFINDNYDLETAYKYLPFDQLERWRFAVNSDNPEYYMNYLDPKTGEYIYHLSSVAPYENDDYIFLKKGQEKDNPELHWETDNYHNGVNGLKKTHDLVYDKNQGRYFYKKKLKTTSKHLEGGVISQDMINQMVKQALLNLLT